MSQLSKMIAATVMGPCTIISFYRKTFHSDLSGCEMDEVNVAGIPDGTSHRDGAIYNNKLLLEEYLDADINDRNETRLEPMRFSKHPSIYSYPQFMVQFFSVLLSRSPISNGPIQLYGYIAARDEKDGMLNYIVNYSRDNPIIVQQGSPIEMTGPKRGILMGSDVIIEFDMRIKMGEDEDDDPTLIDGALVCSCQFYVPWVTIKRRIIGSSGAVDVILAVVGRAVEATIEVTISEVQSGLSLSLSSFVDVGDVSEEIQLFNGLIAQPGALRRFVVAVPIGSTLPLKFMFGNNVELHTTTNIRQIKFGSKLCGCSSRSIRLKAATLSVKYLTFLSPSRLGSVLGTASMAAFGKVVDFLDTLGSLVTTLSPDGGFISRSKTKGCKTLILAFEVANTILKGASIMQSLSEDTVTYFKQVVLPSEGVQSLVSSDMSELMRIAANDKRYTFQ